MLEFCHFPSSEHTGHRFGFNGQEKDDEIYSSSGTSYTAGFWQYDSRLGRRWNLDPVVKHHESPYATFANNPLWFADRDGKDTLMMHKQNIETRFGVVISIATFSMIKDGVETALPFKMYMGASSNYIQLEGNTKESKDFKLDYGRLMTRHPEWKNLSIFVEHPDKSKAIFIHPERYPERNIGCLTISDKEPAISPYRNYLGVEKKSMAFSASSTALQRVRQIYETFEKDLTGDKFILRTESRASSDYVEMKPKEPKGIRSVRDLE